MKIISINRNERNQRAKKFSKKFTVVTLIIELKLFVGLQQIKISGKKEIHFTIALVNLLFFFLSFQFH